MPSDPNDVVEYWLGATDISAADFAEKSESWYATSKDLDDDIRTRFGDDLKMAESGELQDWQETTIGSVALVVLFDQFSRNLYRGSGDAYKNDTQALEIATRQVEGQRHESLPPAQQILLFHPFHHAEDLQSQDKTLRLYENLLAQTTADWQPLIDGHLKFAREHRHIVEEFGRFPHRNAILGRESTQKELAFLDKDSRSYGQSSDN